MSSGSLTVIAASNLPKSKNHYCKIKCMGKTDTTSRSYSEDPRWNKKFKLDASMLAEGVTIDFEIYLITICNNIKYVGWCNTTIENGVKQLPIHNEEPLHNEHGKPSKLWIKFDLPIPKPTFDENPTLLVTKLTFLAQEFRKLAEHCLYMENDINELISSAKEDDDENYSYSYSD